MRAPAFGAFQQSAHQRSPSPPVRNHGTGGRSRPATVASGSVVGCDGSGAIRRTARARRGGRTPAAGNSDAGPEARRGDAGVSGRASGRIHGGTLQHRGAPMGGGSDWSAQAYGAGSERGRVFLARPARFFV